MADITHSVCGPSSTAAASKTASAPEGNERERGKASCEVARLYEGGQGASGHAAGPGQRRPGSRGDCKMRQQGVRAPGLLVQAGFGEKAGLIRVPLGYSWNGYGYGGGGGGYNDGEP